jgi:hypothetical protein
MRGTDCPGQCSTRIRTGGKGADPRTVSDDTPVCPPTGDRRYDGPTEALPTIATRPISEQGTPPKKSNPCAAEVRFCFSAP